MLDAMKVAAFSAPVNGSRSLPLLADNIIYLTFPKRCTAFVTCPQCALHARRLNCFAHPRPRGHRFAFEECPDARDRWSPALGYPSVQAALDGRRRHMVERGWGLLDEALTSPPRTSGIDGCRGCPCTRLTPTGCRPTGRRPTGRRPARHPVLLMPACSVRCCLLEECCRTVGRSRKPPPAGTSPLVTGKRFSFRAIGLRLCRATCNAAARHPAGAARALGFLRS